MYLHFLFLYLLVTKKVCNVNFKICIGILNFNCISNQTAVKLRSLTRAGRTNFPVVVIVLLFCQGSVLVNLNLCILFTIFGFYFAFLTQFLLNNSLAYRYCCRPVSPCAWTVDGCCFDPSYFDPTTRPFKSVTAKTEYCFIFLCTVPFCVKHGMCCTWNFINYLNHLSIFKAVESFLLHPIYVLIYHCTNFSEKIINLQSKIEM